MLLLLLLLSDHVHPSHLKGRLLFGLGRSLDWSLRFLLGHPLGVWLRSKLCDLGRNGIYEETQVAGVRKGRSGIVYCGTRAKTETLAKALQL
mgnify:CR=1 FL=1